MAKNNNKAENVGRWLGQTWLRLARREARVAHWMIDRGASPSIANVLLWIVRLVVIAALLYLAFWLAIVIGAAVIAMALFQSGHWRPQQKKWFPEPNDHREELFYHPITHNHDPDPRFHDPRFQDK